MNFGLELAILSRLSRNWYDVIRLAGRGSAIHVQNSGLLGAAEVEFLTTASFRLR